MSSAKSFWVEDRYASRCSGCNQTFNFVRRRHHCRQCGQIFCSDCLELAPILPQTPSSARGGAKSGDKQSNHPTFLQQGFTALFTNSAEEKVCSNCVKQRRTRVASGVAALRMGAASKRTASVLDRSGGPRSQGASVIHVAQLDSSHTSQASPRAPRVAVPDVSLGDDLESNGSSYEAEGYFPLSRMTSNARTEELRQSTSRPGSPTAFDATLGFTGRMMSLGSMSKSPRAGFRLQSGAHSSFEVVLPEAFHASSSFPYSPHVHTESTKERSISYGNQELPMVQNNAMELWLKKLLRKAATNPVALQAAPTSHAAPKKKVFLANPSACFRVGEKVVDAGLFPTAFLEFEAFEARNGILELLERRCTAHLLRRVRWLIHEVNIRFALEEHVRVFQEKRGNDVTSPRDSTAPGGNINRRTSTVMDMQGGGVINRRRTSLLANKGLSICSPKLPSHHVTNTSNLILTATEDAAPMPLLLNPEMWLEAVCDIAWRVVSQTVCEREPNVLSHVDVLTLEGGDFADMEIISGIAFFHSVANKKMRTRIDHPRVLVLGGDVGLHMAVTETKVGAAAAASGVGPTAQIAANGTVVIPAMEFLEYTSSYKGTLEKQLQRIEVWKPTLIVAERGVHHYLQDRISRDAANITLLTHVGREMLERIAVGTGAEVVDNLASYSITDVLSDNALPLGYCTSFELTSLEPNHVSCAMFSGLPRPTFTSVLLRGAPEKTLQAAKGILLQAISTSHHLALQTHYLVDFNAVISQAQNLDAFEGCTTEELVVDDVSDLLAHPQSPRSAATLAQRGSTEFGSPDGHPGSSTSATPVGAPQRRQSTSNEIGDSSLTSPPTKPSSPPSTTTVIPILPPEALSINMGITFPREVLTCCGGAALVKQCSNAIGIQYSFIRELQSMRDSIMVQNLFLEGPGVQGADASSAGGAQGAASGGKDANAGNTTSPSSSQQHAGNTPGGAGDTSGNSSTNFVSSTGASQVEAAQTVRRQRHNYPFYQEADETLYEFLMDRVTDGKDALRHVLHGNRRVIIRSTSQMKDLFDDMRTGSATVSPTYPAPTRSTLSSPAPPSILSSGTGARGVVAGKKSVAEELSTEYLKHLGTAASGPTKFVRVPHCYTTCRVCLKNRFVTPTTAPIPVSPHTLSMSLGAFLEMSVYMGRECIAMCGHSLHNDLTRYFVMYPTEGNQVTVSFDVEPLPVFQMYGPPLQLRPLPPKTLQITAPPCCTGTTETSGQQAAAKFNSLVITTSTGGSFGAGGGQDATVTNSPSALAEAPSQEIPPPPMGSSPTTPLIALAPTETASFPQAAPVVKKSHDFTLYCTNASELYFAYELQELSRNLFELRNFQMKRYRTSLDGAGASLAFPPVLPTVAASPFSNSPPRIGSPDSLINRYEQVAQQFAELHTLEDTTKYRTAYLYPLIDEVMADKGTTVSSNGTTQGADVNKKASPIDPQSLQGMRSQHWAYLPNERLSVRVNEPTSIIAAVLQAMQTIATPTVTNTNQHKRSHTRTFSMGAGGLEDMMMNLPTKEALAQPRTSKMAQVMHQLGSAFGATSIAQPSPAATSNVAATNSNNRASSMESHQQRRATAVAPEDVPQRLPLEDPAAPKFVSEQSNADDASPLSHQARSRASSCGTAIGNTAPDVASSGKDGVMVSHSSLLELDLVAANGTSAHSIDSHGGGGRREEDPSGRSSISPPLCGKGVNLAMVHHVLGGGGNNSMHGDALPPKAPHSRTESPSTTPTPPIPQGGDEDQFCAVPSLYADAMLGNTTTIEDLLFDMNRGDSPQPHQRCQSAVPSSCVDASHSEVTADTHTTTISPSVNMMDNSETMSQTFVRDQFRREDEAIDVLSGKSTQQASSFKYVIRDLVMPAEATKPNNIVVEVMFPHQFAAMRYLYARDLFARESSDEYSSSAPQGSNGSAATLTEDGIISSLLRCKLYNAQGGKSGAGFFITQDERLMLKKIKLTELRHFVQFAPQYFEHMVQLCMHVQHQKRARMRRPASACASEGGEGDIHAHDDQAASGGDDPSGEPTDCSLGDYSSFSTDEVPPSALSKIFGVFSISFKKTRGPFAQSEVRYYMLTENIMYRRPVELSYDLKGSQLNRHAAEGSHVLLDQDLVRETKKGFFFYCRESSRARVVDALTNDAQRLCAASIMDYSAIVSVDKRSETLAFGVIDYLHPYTGAKVLESKVKGGIENMFGQGRDPTIIDPHHYKQRFLRWMDSYLCGVPDKIAQLKKRAVTVVSPHDDEAEGSSFDDKWRVPRRADIPQTRVVQMLQGGALVQLEDVEYRVV